MRAKPLKTRDLILSLSKDEAKISWFFSSLLNRRLAKNRSLFHLLPQPRTLPTPPQTQPVNPIPSSPQAPVRRTFWSRYDAVRECGGENRVRMREVNQGNGLFECWQ
jgi:hypothetical protein